ncbi:dehydrase and lipid transport-domain-containing protein [Lasiosphaeria hispida]|uniref:Dehydrase and lipid transport-domain-containing protein n=1 Tax=Lasiosphaeria hispida TaxID=260671 RepID=A0AAJ0HR26_9PEZI|nr:dehydrase and lipid transport-domain-containing protein [Lasiosphaeria hispida]
MARLTTPAHRLARSVASWRPSPSNSCAPFTTALHPPSTTTPRRPLLPSQQPLLPPTRRPLTSFLSSLLPTDSNNPTPPQTLRARRILPYPPAQLYTIIADIDSYRVFLPHCTASRVTAWTALPAPQQQQQQQGDRRYPALADLTVGWGPLTQSYTSRVYCVPGSIVEAVSGAARTTISADTLAQHGYNVAKTPAGGGGSGGMAPGVFESLVTRWTVKAVPAGRSRSGSVDETGEWTEVSLSVQFRFANPALGYAVGRLADDKVEEMIQAFEDRARVLYGRV